MRRWPASSAFDPTPPFPGRGTTGGAVTSYLRRDPCVLPPARPLPMPRGPVPEDPVTQPHDDGVPVEHDPTGMRALLAGLPDPGPMPDELVSRITAALAAEADAGQAPAGARPNGTEPPASPRPAGKPVPMSCPSAAGPPGFATSGSRPRSWRRWGWEPTVSRCCRAVGWGLSTRSQAGATPARTPRAGSMDRVRRRLRGGAVRPGPAVRVAPAPGSGEVVVVMSGTKYTEEGLVVSARSVAEADLAPLADLAAEAPTIGPIGTPVGARSCADALGIPAICRTPRRPGRARRPSGGRRRRASRAAGARHTSSSAPAPPEPPAPFAVR